MIQIRTFVYAAFRNTLCAIFFALFLNNSRCNESYTNNTKCNAKQKNKNVFFFLLHFSRMVQMWFMWWAASIPKQPVVACKSNSTINKAFELNETMKNKRKIIRIILLNGNCSAPWLIWKAIGIFRIEWNSYFTIHNICQFNFMFSDFWLCFTFKHIRLQWIEPWYHWYCWFSFGFYCHAKGLVGCTLYNRYVGKEI